jgi:hypothetical protein
MTRSAITVADGAVTILVVIGFIVWAVTNILRPPPSQPTASR